MRLLKNVFQVHCSVTLLEISYGKYRSQIAIKATFKENAQGRVCITLGWWRVFLQDLFQRETFSLEFTQGYAQDDKWLLFVSDYSKPLYK